MFSEHAFFSFVDLADPEMHRAYNEWHQLDHRPENLLLPGVAWGDRWARPAEYAELGRSPATSLAGTDYVAMYWFRPPYEESVAEWHKLGEDSFQWGRGPRIPGVRRPLLAFFTPVKGYAAPRIGVSAEALPFRPNRGLHITVTYHSEPHGLDTHEQFHWEDRVHIPTLLERDGVAGAWTFSLHSLPGNSSLRPEPEDDHRYTPGTVRIRLLYLDHDPAEVSRDLASFEQDREAAGFGRPCPEAAELLLDGPLRTIIPWKDW
ncbi:hypothetical protein AB0H60_11125 [Nocardia rhamnosiphila]|uniref:hypothetical protein n=1 Tax=Nocardia rhamnosiphila TaxID=426716 RepID=UPI003403F3C0